jgi:hypothetical protein
METKINQDLVKFEQAMGKLRAAVARLDRAVEEFKKHPGRLHRDYEKEPWASAADFADSLAAEADSASARLSI